MLADVLIAMIRTFVPAAVGTAFAWLAAQGLPVDDSLTGMAATSLVTVCVTGYYGVVTVLERRVWPGFGWLLGYAHPPTYAADRPVVAGRVVSDASGGSAAPTVGG